MLSAGPPKRPIYRLSSEIKVKNRPPLSPDPPPFPQNFFSLGGYLIMAVLSRDSVLFVTTLDSNRNSVLLIRYSVQTLCSVHTCICMQVVLFFYMC
jgi:hypothetical protein